MADTHSHVLHCPYCLSAVVPADDSVVCSACGIPHHRECWQLNGRCTTYGCVGHPASAFPEPDPEALEGPLGEELHEIELQRARAHAGADPDTALDADDDAPATPGGGSGPPSLCCCTGLAVPFMMLMYFLLLTVAQELRPLRPPQPPPPWSPPPRPGVAIPALGTPPPRVGPNSRLIKHRCHLQSLPGDDTSRSGDLDPGTVVEIVRTHGAWVYVRLDAGDSGYLPRSALATMDSARFLPAEKPPPGRQP